MVLRYAQYERQQRDGVGHGGHGIAKNARFQWTIDNRYIIRLLERTTFCIRAKGNNVYVMEEQWQDCSGDHDWLHGEYTVTSKYDFSHNHPG